MACIFQALLLIKRILWYSEINFKILKNLGGIVFLLIIVRIHHWINPLSRSLSLFCSIFNNNIINYRRICFLKLDNAVPLLQKRPFLPLFWHKTVVDVKITNHYYKVLTPSQIYDREGIFEPWFWYHHNQILRLKFLQRCGHQIKVNTWTGSYEEKRYEGKKIPF